MTNINLSALKPSIEAAYDCHQVMGNGAEQASYLQWMLKPHYDLLHEAWKLLGKGNESLLTFAEKLRKE